MTDQLERKPHNFVREEYRTEYEALQNRQYVIYCTRCGYIAHETHLGDNAKRQENLPAECI